jgi:hypothetical protein
MRLEPRLPHLLLLQMHCMLLLRRKLLLMLGRFSCQSLLPGNAWSFIFVFIGLGHCSGYYAFVHCSLGGRWIGEGLLRPPSRISRRLLETCCTIGLEFNSGGGSR